MKIGIRKLRINKKPYLFDCFNEIVELSKEYSCRWHRAGKLTSSSSAISQKQPRTIAV